MGFMKPNAIRHQVCGILHQLEFALMSLFKQWFMPSKKHAAPLWHAQRQRGWDFSDLAGSWNLLNFSEKLQTHVAFVFTQD